MNPIKRRDPYGDLTGVPESTDGMMPAMPQKKKPGGQKAGGPAPPPMAQIPPPAQMGPFQPLPDVGLRQLTSPMQGDLPMQGGGGQMDLQALIQLLMNPQHG